MTKYFELNWKIPVAPKLQEGTVGDRWTEENQNFDFEAECQFKIDECGFFISWKSEGKVKISKMLETRRRFFEDETTDAIRATLLTKR